MTGSSHKDIISITLFAPYDVTRRDERYSSLVKLRGLGDVCFYLMTVSALAGIRRAFDYWSKQFNRIFYQRKSEQCFCQIYSCNTMQFSEACHREDTKTPLFPGLTGAVVTNLEMVARRFSHSPSWPYKPIVASSSIRLSSLSRTRVFIQWFHPLWTYIAVNYLLNSIQHNVI